MNKLPTCIQTIINCFIVNLLSIFKCGNHNRTPFVLTGSATGSRTIAHAFIFKGLSVAANISMCFYCSQNVQSH